jgi:carotenoid cleavage dioxygenase
MRGAAPPGAFPAIYKHDLRAGTSTTLELPRGRHAAEPFFVPRDRAETEDDGYLMTFVFDETSDTSELVIFDARTLSHDPIARVHLPARVPYGFHGSWIPDGYDGPSV